MGIFNFGKNNSPATPITPGSVNSVAPTTATDTGRLAVLALNTIQDGVVIVNKDGVIKFINPAAVDMTGCEKADNAVNLDFSLIMKFEKTDGSVVDEKNNPFLNAVKTNQAFDSREYVLLSKLNDKKTPLALRLTPSGDARSDRIITFRNIAKELEEEGSQTEFISTASHEMRTPVASIEGYLGLALNPQTATIDERARQYLESAHSASKHLGNLFRDLLDVTKLDDKRIRVRLVPLELTGFVKKFADEYIPKFAEKNIKYSFGSDDAKSQRFSGGKNITQVVYTFADVDFLGEILANLIENAIKYTPEGGAVWVNVQGDGDRALINVTDTGIGIAAEDLQHIFQKFYRADNSQTRTVGGTGLGLYLVKARVEAMAGRVWAESAFGEGSTFYVSLPRLTAEEFEKRQIAEQNQRAVQAFAETGMQATAKQPVMSTSPGAPVQGPTFDPSLLAQSAPAQPVAMPQQQVAQPQQIPMHPQQVQAPTVQLSQQIRPIVQAPVYQQPVAPSVGVAPALQPTAMIQQPVQSTVPQAAPVQPLQAPVINPAQQPANPNAVGIPVPPQVQNPAQYGGAPIQSNQNIIQ